MSRIIFGPAGLGGVNVAVANLEFYASQGIKACEIAFTYGPYIKTEEQAKKIKEASERLGIKLSIHAHYWINLNSEDKKKIEESKKRILECCKVGTWLGAYKIVFHPGYYGKSGKEETYEAIKEAISEIEEERKKNNYTPELAPETTGKVNVFGSLDETLQLVQDTKCSFCIDFAHILAREKRIDYKNIFDKLKKFKDIHVHFSGIVYGEKGERHHVKTERESVKELLHNINEYAKEKNFVIINESPIPVEDSVMSIDVFSKLK